MALILNEYEACPHAYRCSHFNNGSVTCQGANKYRRTRFHCSFFKDNIIDESKFRNSHDETGQMKLLLE